MGERLSTTPSPGSDTGQPPPDQHPAPAATPRRNRAMILAITGGIRTGCRRHRVGGKDVELAEQRGDRRGERLLRRRSRRRRGSCGESPLHHRRLELDRPRDETYRALEWEITKIQQTSDTTWWSRPRSRARSAANSAPTPNAGPNPRRPRLEALPPHPHPPLHRRPDPAPNMTRSEQSPYEPRFANVRPYLPCTLLVASPVETGLGHAAGASQFGPYDQPSKSVRGETCLRSKVLSIELGIRFFMARRRSLSFPRATIGCLTARGGQLMDGSDDRLDLYPGLADWWRTAEQIWLENRTSDRLTLTERLNFRRG